MKHIVKVESLENLPETRPIVAMDENKNIKWLAKPYTLTFINTSGDYNWNNPNNWDLKKVPSIIDTAIIDASVNIGNKAKCNNLIIDSSVAVVTVMPTGGLIVGKDGISGASIDNLILKAGTEGNIKGQTGFLKISPEYEGEMPEATVEMFSIGYYPMNEGNSEWQLVGSPIDFNGMLAKTVFTKSWIYSWVLEQNEWVNKRSTLVMEPFICYYTTQFQYKDGILLIYKGALLQNLNTIINLNYIDSEHCGNSLSNGFIAPIDLTKLRPTDFINAEPVIKFVPTSSHGHSKPITINITTPENIINQCHSAGISHIIPSMQGFWVYATGENAQLILDYERLVWNGDNINCPLC